MSPARRQKMLLGVLGFLVLVMVWNYLPPLGGGGGEDAGGPAPQLGGTGSFDEGDESGPPRRRVRREDDDVPTRDVIDLKVASLEAPPRASRPGRDPWRFVDPPPPPEPPPPPPPSAAELAARRAAEEEAARLRAEAEARALEEARRPKPPPFTLKLIGSFGPPNRKIASFTDGKTIWNVREGGVLQEKFRVARIGYESVYIEFVGFPEVPAQPVAVGR